RHRVVSSLLTRSVVLCLTLITDPATPVIYTLSLHDALPISQRAVAAHDLSDSRPGPAGGTVPAIPRVERGVEVGRCTAEDQPLQDRKSTRLNSSHLGISYAVFCLKKKKTREDCHAAPAT